MNKLYVVLLVIVIIVASAVTAVVLQEQNQGSPDNSGNITPTPSGTNPPINNAELVQISNGAFISSNKVLLFVRNMGGADATLSSAKIDGQEVSFSAESGHSLIVGKGGAEIQVTLTLSSGSEFVVNKQYEVSIVTAKGETITCTATYPNGVMSSTDAGEKVAVTNSVFDSQKQVTLTVKNSGTEAVKLVRATISGNSVTLTPVSGNSLEINAGSSAQITIILPENGLLSLKFFPGVAYEIRIVTEKSTVIDYTATYNP